MYKTLLLTLMLATLSSCGKKNTTVKPWEPQSEPLSKYGNHSPYRVNGRLYRVNNHPEGFTQTGRASWYGKKFHGKKTSNMETFDMHKLTAAHKTLPLPCYVEVTNLANGKTIVVRVNDRGPFAKNRIIDLSYAAAKALDFVNQGTTKVKIKLIEAPQGFAQQPLITQGDSYIQFGAFADKSTAYNLARKIAEQLGIKTLITIINSSTGSLHRVRIGPFESEQELQQLMQNINQKGLFNAQIVSE